MMEKMVSIPLDARLKLCASFVREGTRLADVGTDHAYLPVKLAAEGKILSAVACDIRQGPLDNARSNILRFGVEDKVTTVLSDGLDAVPPDSAWDIVIAGMGGELMAAIIRRTRWLYDGKRRLILQPMTRAEVLRTFLCENGFCIEEEKACAVGGKCYSVMQCRYDGIVRPCDERMAYIGRLSKEDAPEAAQYIDMVIRKLQRKINGLRHSECPEEAAVYERILRAVSDDRHDDISEGGTAMVCAGDIYAYLNEIAPFDTAMSFDNVGLLIGDCHTVSDKVLVTLDATAAVLQEAHRIGAKIVVTHHPIIFEPLRSLSVDSAPYVAVQYGITVLSAHTNLDIAPDGVNDTLAAAVGVTEQQRFDEDCALLGTLEKDTSCQSLAVYLRETLRLSGLRYTDRGHDIRRILVSCGAGGSNVPLAIQCGADAIVTGEIKHHQILMAKEHDIAVFDLGHFGSEKIIVPKLAAKLQEKFPAAQFLQAEADTDGMLYL